jgi:hypothetical protein
MNITKCGDRRCTIEEADFELKGYREGYAEFTKHRHSTNIDSLNPVETRIKTEIDEAGELMESAKKKGADAWGEVHDKIVAALDHLKESYHAAVGETSK